MLRRPGEYAVARLSGRLRLGRCESDFRQGEFVVLQEFGICSVVMLVKVKIDLTGFRRRDIGSSWRLRGTDINGKKRRANTTGIRFVASVSLALKIEATMANHSIILRKKCPQLQHDCKNKSAFQGAGYGHDLEKRLRRCTLCLVGPLLGVKAGDDRANGLDKKKFLYKLLPKYGSPVGRSITDGAEE